ncbi:23S rRNA (guanosine(2251)-2'-O)-methyltransferase RlmB [Bacteroidales bacterium OttesenSCG-928-I21]|nr:23S rRNA (guanosine(2251)-2'-O)-methyltransferase RlmB [Bacteroidales bacterium OttesenSCG-928-I21]
MSNIIFGIRPILEALKAQKDIEKVLVTKNPIGELAGELFSELRKKNIPIQYVPIEKINKITTNNHQGVVAYISPVSYHDIEDIVSSAFESGETPLVVILDSITDVRNFGALARTCECAGVHAIVIPKKNSVSISEDAIKTSAGALFNIPICRVDNLVDTVLLLQQMGLLVLASTEKAYNNIYDHDLKQPTAIILGSEDVGISNQLLKRADHLVKIPMYGKTESLNVSVSAAIIVYEIIRQRKFVV